MSGYQQTDVPVPESSPVKLCWADLDATITHAGDRIAAQISAGERERANRFHRAMDRDRFMASRYLLRRILGAYTGIPGREIEISLSPFGKPGLVGNSIQFNLSHSGKYFALGISQSARIGVDAESRMTLETANEVSRGILSDHEYKWWNTLTPDNKVLFMTRFWTLKEAILKAYGEGFSQDPKEIELGLHGPVPEIVRLPVSFGGQQDWRIFEKPASQTFPAISLALLF